VSLTFRQSRHLFLCIGAQKLLPLHFSQTLLCHWWSQTVLPPESLRFVPIRWCARTVLPHQLSLHSVVLAEAAATAARSPPPLRCSRGCRLRCSPPWHL
jgi:hypothetical protein